MLNEEKKQMTQQKEIKNESINIAVEMKDVKEAMQSSTPSSETISEKILAPGDSHRSPNKELAGTVILDESLQEIVIVHGKKSGKWGLPKGHVEPGESHIEAAIRETKEETGLKINLAVKMLPCILSKRAKLFLLVLPRKETEFKTVDTAEISEVLWYKIEDLPNLAEKNRMLSGIYNRIDHVRDKIRRNQMNYYHYGVEPGVFTVNRYLHNLLDSLVDKTDVQIIEQIHNEFKGIYHEPEIKEAMAVLRTVERSTDEKKPVTVKILKQGRVAPSPPIGAQPQTPLSRS